MKKGSIPQQIIGSFEDIGKSIAEETGKVPSELLNAALEGRTPVDEAGKVQVGEGKPGQGSPGGETLKKLTQQEIDAVVARKALLALTNRSEENQPRPSVYEERMREEETKEKKKDEALEQEKDIRLTAEATTKKKANRYGLAAKQTKTERKLGGVD